MVSMETFKYTQDYVSLYPVYLRNIYIARLQKHISKKNLLKFLLHLYFFEEKQAILHTASQYLTEKIIEQSVDKWVHNKPSFDWQGLGGSGGKRIKKNIKHASYK